MATDSVKEIPYGVSDYVTITRDNCYYVDKTNYIPLIERAARFFFLIRPRRFGKSLMLSVLESYYDINNADRFEQLFGERWIYQHPTSLRAKFLILRFNFSAVSTDPDFMASSFEEHCREQFMEFAGRYHHLFKSSFTEELEERASATAKLQFVNRTASERGLRIYLIIDEYDNFTNSILATVGNEAYHKATHGDGFYRYFFNVLKTMTTGSGVALERMFITGVSPITLDDVTSGFNIGTNFTTSPLFNSLVGFSEDELRTMLEYYHGVGKLKQGVEEAIEEMKPWYNNYCFAEESLGENMYNSDMVLYYINHCLLHGSPPAEMIDKNIRMDYTKLRHLIKTDKQLDDSFSVIREVVEKGYTTTIINDSFPALAMKKPDNFKSLLYYFGLLSIHGTEVGKAVLAIPNHTVREQMYGFMREGFADTNIFRLNFEQFGQLMETMALKGEWKPVFAYIASEMERQSRIREFIDGEAHIKSFLLPYLNMTHYYLTLPEYELAKGYADFYFQPNPRLTDMKYAYLLEVKYMKRDEPESRIAVLKEEARAQLQKYSSDKMIADTLMQAELKFVTIVFRGWEIVDMEEL